MKYKLIKTYPGFKVLGTIIEIDSQQETGYYSENTQFWQPVVEKDYEILSVVTTNYCRVKNSILTLNEYEKLYPDIQIPNNFIHIRSFRRISDGEIFTIGDIIYDKYNKDILYRFESFNICKSSQLQFKAISISKNNCSVLAGTIDDRIIKSLPILFTTEDGVDIFEGDDYYYINSTFINPWDIIYTCATNSKIIDKNNLDYKRFSTREVAKEYILYNKPCLSLNEVFNLMSITSYPNLKEKIEDLVKSKIQSV